MPIEHTPVKEVNTAQKMSDMKTSVHLRGQVKAKITRIRKAIEEANATNAQYDSAQLKMFSHNLENHYKEFLNIHHHVVAVCPPERIDEQDEVYLVFETQFNETYVLLERAIQASRDRSVVQPQVQTNESPRIIVQQQPLKAPIPTFDGKPENWPRFKTMFSDVMRSSTDSDCIKLYHLERSLVGAAAGIIDARTLNNNNYAHAWEILEDRFENKRVIVDIHIQGLLSLRRLNRENQKELRELIDEVTRHVDGLALIDNELDGVGERFVVNLVSGALDKDTRKEWEASIPHKEIPSYEDTIEFLKKRCAILERCEGSSKIPSIMKPYIPVKNAANQMKNAQAKSCAITRSSETICDICSGMHSNFKCEVFRAMSIPQRQAKVRELRMCYNCLQKGHPVSSCSSSRTCQKCQGQHNTLLHVEKTSFVNTKPVPFKQELGQIPKVPEEKPITTSCSISKAPLDNSLLMTAVVNILDSNGKFHPCRAFLDCGSQAHLISARLLQMLKLPHIPAKVEIIGANGKKTTLNNMAKTEIRSIHSDYHAQIECLVTARITGVMPSRKINTQFWSIPPGLPLADPTFHIPGEIDLLIGIKLFFQLLMPNQLKISNDLPILQETRLGWVVAGAMDDENVDLIYNRQQCHAVILEPLNKTMEKFWFLESVGSSPLLSNEEQQCESKYCSTTTRDINGRYIVQLPLKDTASNLKSNRSLALRRFFMLEQRLKKKYEMKELYGKFIDEYKQLGHCQRVNELDDTPGKITYYLPHHAVLKPSSSTTKLRVVFDASAKSSGVSLNETLMIGPTVQDDLFSILLRFRRHRYAFTADISKMYRQIRIDPSQTSLQRIFWRKEPTDPLEVLEMTTVTYGTSSAPFLATRTLKQLAIDETKRYPVAAKIVEEDFYVDDVLSGADTVEDAIQSRLELTHLLHSGGFPIHKWCANDEAIIETVPEGEREKFLTFEDADINESIKTLGLLWDPKKDIFLFVPDCFSSNQEPPTKRRVLSEIARLFDPLGLVSPVIVNAKAIMQQVWLSKLDWDDILEGDLLTEWQIFRDSLHQIQQIRIPRYMALHAAIHYEIHGFADASNLAYGACIYIRAVSNQIVKTTLICSKSKIAPINGLTMPRMELCAALLLSRLASKVVPALKMNFNQITYYSDSQIFLGWLRKSPIQLELFVRNRIMEINNQTQNAQWRYVRTDENPADVVSRGQLPQQLAVNYLWWNGPSFLRNHVIQNEEPEPIPDCELPEWKPTVIVTPVVRLETLPFMTKFSSFRRLQRIVGYILRFIRNTKLPRSLRNISKFLTIPEMRQSLEVIVRYIQQTELFEDIHSLKSGQPTRRLANLCPIIDNDLLRVGGRLQNSRLSYNAKHQLILPNKNPITESLVRALHEENLHVGPSGLISLIRQRFWLLNARNTVRKVTRSCIICFRSNPKLLQPPMGNLPEARVVPSAPFSRTGVDFAGPIFIRRGGRKSVPVKAYISLFICLSTKAIHFEVVSDLTAAAFIAALHRFVARRGLVEEIHSDNGTNFAGARTELHDLYLLFQKDQMQGKLNDFCQPREIIWRFIPPRAPNFGGLWEAGVKSTKTHLKKILRNASLTFEEYYTVLTQIEAILNSRPLFSHSTDPTELEVITPAHFLIGRQLTAIPEPTLEDVPENRLTRWQHLQKLRDHFWKRWSNEYLNTLQTRQKWTKHSKNITPGVVVLLKEENTPPQSWKLGKIVTVYPGADCTIRVADVQTAAGLYRRPVSKLAPLPFESNVPQSNNALDLSAGGECSQPLRRVSIST
ncbi:hypothetical protein RP20_CCG022513 [Aedes albopictus]|nr:hypothetical protein RP20_CCG022513 [Aedes albopictus]